MRVPSGSDIVYYFCACGTIFHNKPLDKKRFTDSYLKNVRDAKFFHDRLDYARYIYMPVIEEHLYGRESFDIGFGFPENIIDMRQRGWIADGIDIVKNDYRTGDFEEFNTRKKYDLVIMSHILGAFNDPLKALEKAVKMLKKGGILFVAAPDTSVTLTTGYKDFGHWSDENRTMMSLARTKQELMRLGMEAEPILQIQNFSKRFLYFNDFHLIMRKGLKD